MHPTEPVQRSSALPPSGDQQPPWGGAPPPAAPAPDQPRKRRALRVQLTTGGRVGLSMVALMLFVAVFAPLLAPHDVGTIVTPDVFAAFSAKLPFGSDFLGRDMLSRILYGTRLTVLLALAAVLLAALTGTTLGLLATVSGRAVDETMSRLLDALTSIPSKMFALMLVAAAVVLRK